MNDPEMTPEAKHLEKILSLKLQSVMKKRHEWINACAERALPPALSRAAKSGKHLCFVSYWMERHWVRIVQRPGIGMRPSVTEYWKGDRLIGTFSFDGRTVTSKIIPPQ